MEKFILKVSQHRVLHGVVMWLTEAILIALSGWVAFLLRFDLRLPSAFVPYLLIALAVWIPAKVLIFHFAGLDRGAWRYVFVNDLVRAAVGNTVASTASAALIMTLFRSGFPRSVYLLDLMICFLATAGLRLVASLIIQASSQRDARGTRKRIFIYGAGDAGIILLREIRSNPRLPYQVVGFLDDRPDKMHLRLGGVMVYSGGEHTPALVRKHHVETILIAIPSATGAEIVRILGYCHAAGVECKTVPGVAEMIRGDSLAGQIRTVAVEDLLGRNPIHLDQGQIRQALAGQMVMVTGAAGSIGSELCRQIAQFRPAGIVGFDIAETPLFEIDREMKMRFPDVPFIPEIGSIQNRARLDDLMNEYRLTAVYHAAAYKHVPLMETHVFEAVENNIFGTYNVAMAAAEHGIRDFVMISTDKAVRPTNVMGATKRVAELIILALQVHEKTKYVAVRFGNVLGSNGSVIPIFQKQIVAGGPITVTHPEMRRFFMTIPEACQLVLQSTVVADAGQICVLDMGQPVKIVDLARNLILLSGMRPEEDIKIEFTGIRPGEKLYEELSSLLEGTVPSTHEKIRIFVGPDMEEREVERWLRSLRQICSNREIGELVVALKEAVTDYNPDALLLRRALQPRDQAMSSATK